MIKTKFLQICIGISVVTLSIGFLLQSVQKASAATTASTIFQPQTSKIGRYITTVMTYGGRMYAVTCDTENGQSSVNYYEGEWKKDSGKPQTNAMDK